MMKCNFCNEGEMEKGKAKVFLEKGDAVMMVDGVPADVCSICGEYELSREVRDELEMKVNHILQYEAQMKWMQRRMGSA